MILSYKDINEIANNIIKRYESLIGKEIDRVNIVDLLSRLYEVDVDYYALSKNHEILGLASPKDITVEVYKNEEPILVQIGMHLVLVDSSLLDSNLIGRKNFTIAHEGAHQILFRMETNKTNLSLRTTYKSVTEHRLVTKNDWEEWQANTLASCLLLPEKQVRRVFWMMFSETYINSIHPVNKKNYIPFVAMAAYFGVSKEALAIRLRQLKLIGVYMPENPLSIYQEVS